MFDTAEEIYSVNKLLQKIVPIIILAIGTFGNILCFSVLARYQARHFSTAVYLLALTCVDFMAMHSGLIRMLVQGYFEFDVRLLSSASCKIHSFCVYFSTHSSSWLIVVVTMERVISVWKPLLMKARFSSVKTAVRVVCVLLIIIALINSHFFYGFTLRPDSLYDNMTDCLPVGKDYMHFIDNVWPWIDLTILFLLPLCFILFGNTLIIVRIHRSRKMRRRSCPTIQTSPEYFLTGLLITLNVVFVLCVSPIVIFVLGQYTWWPNSGIVSEKQLAVNILIWTIVNLLVYVNYAVNFIFYLACGSKFRADLRGMCFCLMQPVRILLGSRSSSSSTQQQIPNVDILSIRS